MIYLERKNKFYTKSSFDNFSEIKINDSGFSSIEGYRFKTRQMFTARTKVGIYLWIVQHVNELYILFSEIGVINLKKYLTYVVSPKVIYVDAVKIKLDESEESIYFFKKGIILKNNYSQKDLRSANKVSKNLEPDTVVKTYVIETLSKDSKQVKDFAYSGKSLKFSNPNNNWLVAGSGNFAASILIPSIINSGGHVIACCSNSGASSFYLAKAFKIPNVYSSIEEMISADLPAKNILIATPPVWHPDHIKVAIEANLKIYSEKPVAVSYEDIEKLQAYSGYENIMIGFNRRFAPAVQSLVISNEYIENKNNLIVTYIVNLGEFSVSMATKEIGGGTTVGSCCHYLDLLEYICDSEIMNFFVVAQKDSSDNLVYGSSFSCILNMTNGSTANLIFKRSLSPSNGIKELISIVGESINANISDFKKLTINGKNSNFYLFSKGWKGAMKHFHSSSILQKSSKTSTLLKGNRITKLAMDIDKEIERVRS